MGGRVSTTLTTASALARRGHDVDVVSVIRRQHGVNGLRVKRDNVPGFAHAVGSLIADPGRRVALGQASRQTALACAPDALAKHRQVLFESLTVT